MAVVGFDPWRRFHARAAPAHHPTTCAAGQRITALSGALRPCAALEDNDDVQEIRDYIGESLTQTSLTTADEDAYRQNTVPTQARDVGEAEYRDERRDRTRSQRDDRSVAYEHARRSVERPTQPRGRTRRRHDDA